ncbi:STAS domain-containing protein [Micromonospora psammae]|uniref:STAS domain-containing protein n=1 Tax=Micromonospora sp. CPCC 205556 TaxID=3122398 RepID=UPI003FA58F69
MAKRSGSLGVDRDPIDTLVSLFGEIDLSGSDRLREVLREPGNCTGVVVDLARVTFIDSSVIGVLIKAAATLPRPAGVCGWSTRPACAAGVARHRCPSFGHRRGVTQHGGQWAASRP